MLYDSLKLSILGLKSIIQMGCVNENGCLGPKKRARDVYADLLDSIHEEAQKIQFSK